MEKDVDKLLSRTLFTYFTVLFVVFILKIALSFNYSEINIKKIKQKINKKIKELYK